MPITEGIAALKSLKSLYEIAKDVRDSNDPEKLRAAAAQMFDLALAAREQTAALQEERNNAISEATGLKDEIARINASRQDMDRYELISPFRGITVYALKADMRSGQPPHWLA